MIKSEVKRAFGLIPLILFSGQAAHAEETNLYQMSLDELLRVQVVSKTEENISLTPGIVSVYYPAQLQQMGMHSMADFLRFATSMEYNYSVSGINPVQLRGLADANNQKILFLIDNIPYWMPSHGDIPVNGIPLVAIERIEVIRGPASVIYGTNSSSGVINIVTKNNRKGELSTYVNSNSVVRAGIYHSTEISGGKLNWSIETKQDNGFAATAINTLDVFDPACLCFPTAPPGTIDRAIDYTNFFANFTYDDFKLTVQKYQEDTDSIASGTFLSPSVQKFFGTLIAADYEYELDNIKVNFYSDWNQFYWRRDIQGILAFSGIPGDGNLSFENDGKANYRWRNGINFNYSVSESSRWLFGIEHETRSTENNKFRDQENGAVLFQITQPPFNLPFQLQPDGSILLIESSKVEESAILSQYDYQSENWRLVAGFRYVDNEVSGSHFSPRLSYIYSFDTENSIKLLYSEGFNSPTFRQITARNSFGIPQDVDVEAEIIKTIDLAYSRSTESTSQTFNLFFTEVSDLIQSSFAGISNSDEKIKRSGLEYEFQAKFENVDFLGGVTYLHQGNQSIANDFAASFASRWLLKFGMTYQTSKHQYGASLKSASDRINVDSYYQLDASYQYNFDDWQFYITANNLLDEEFFNPDVRNLDAVIYQSEPERSLSLGFTVNF